MPHRVVVVGSYNRDMVLRTRRIPRPGETVIGGSFSSGHGAKERTRLWQPRVQGRLLHLSDKWDLMHLRRRVRGTDGGRDRHTASAEASILAHRDGLDPC